MSQVARHRQRGITVIGFLILAVAFGVVGLAAIKVAADVHQEHAAVARAGRHGSES